MRLVCRVELADRASRIPFNGLSGNTKNCRSLDSSLAGGVALGAWLLVVEPSQGSDLLAELADALSGAASVVDQSSGYEVLRLGGRALKTVLAKGVALDFHAEAFGLDAAAVTLANQVNVILWRVDRATS